jgi:DedD protein
MEKEQKKLLLVAVSLGVFLLVTTTVAIILTSRIQTQESYFSSSRIIQPSIQPEVIRPQETVFSVITETHDAGISTDTNDGERLTIQIPRPTTAAVPDAPETAVSTPVIAPVTTGTTSAAQTVPETRAVASQPAATTRAAQPSTAVSRPPAPARTTNDYWVQTGAFSARVRAEDAKDLLASKGLVSIIENREINGRLWYRVRLGPYTSEREANYWLSLVQSIDGFGESQVRQTTRQL